MEVKVAQKDEVVEFLGIGAIESVRFLSIDCGSGSQSGVAASKLVSHESDCFSEIRNRVFIILRFRCVIRFVVETNFLDRW